MSVDSHVMLLFCRGRRRCEFYAKSRVGAISVVTRDRIAFTRGILGTVCSVNASPCLRDGDFYRS